MAGHSRPRDGVASRAYVPAIHVLLSVRLLSRGCPAALAGNSQLCYKIPIGTGEAVMAHERIETNPDIMGGKPVIRGTRVPVEMVLRKLGGGMTVEAIVADHPRLTRDDILAAQAFAADYLADEDIVYG
jgi:uncharacterized protein (DUF433 family)